MTRLTAIREGIAQNLQSLTAGGVQVSAYVLAEPTPPTVQILPGPVTYDLAMARGVDTYELVVQALAPLTVDVDAQQLLDELIDEPDSIKTLVESDRTLGGVAADLRVTECSGYQVTTLEGRGPTLFCEWTVLVYAAGN